MGLRRSGVITVWSGLLGAASGVFLAVVPPSVPDYRFSYPLAPGAFAAIQLWFAVQHAGVLAGIAALARSGVAGRSRWTRVASWMACLGMVGLASMEIVAMTAANASYPSPQTGPIDAGYGFTSMAIGVGLVGVGVSVLRARRWSGWRRWVPLALGVWVFVPMTPAMMGPFVVARLAITAWMLLFAALGVALMQVAEPLRSGKRARALAAER